MSVETVKFQKNVAGLLEAGYVEITENGNEFLCPYHDVYVYSLGSMGVVAPEHRQLTVGLFRESIGVHSRVFRKFGVGRTSYVPPQEPEQETTGEDSTDIPEEGVAGEEDRAPFSEGDIVFCIDATPGKVNTTHQLKPLHRYVVTRVWLDRTDSWAVNVRSVRYPYRFFNGLFPSRFVPASEVPHLYALSNLQYGWLGDVPERELNSPDNLNFITVLSWRSNSDGPIDPQVTILEIDDFDSFEDICDNRDVVCINTSGYCFPRKGFNPGKKGGTVESASRS